MGSDLGFGALHHSTACAHADVRQNDDIHRYRYSQTAAEN